MDNNIVNSDIPELSSTPLAPSKPQGSERPAPSNANGKLAEARHHRCAVCRHPEREAIEEAFLHWRSPNQIAIDHDLSDEASIHRHAHALGLFDQRSRNLRFALENFIERVDEIQVVAPDALVRAVCAYTRMTKTGEWLEPSRQVTVTHVKAADAPASGPESAILRLIAPEAYSSRLPRLQGRAKGRVTRARNRIAKTKKS